MADTRRRMTVTLEMTAPRTVGESEVENALNAALDEPPCDWGDWTVGGVEITDVAVIREGEEDD